MDPFVQELSSFEKIHSWWSDETFLKADNTTLKNFVHDTICESSYMEDLATNGTATAIEELVMRLTTESPKMIIATLLNFLDYLFLFDRANAPFSKELVAWYRSKGWQFPPFSHEVVVKKLNDADQD